MPRVWQILASPAESGPSVTKVWIWLIWALRTGALVVGGDAAARLVGEVLHAGRDNGAALNSRQRTLVAEIVEVLADGLGRNFKALGEVFHHHPAKGAGDIENFGLAVGQSGHCG